MADFVAWFVEVESLLKVDPHFRGFAGEGLVVNELGNGLDAKPLADLYDGVDDDLYFGILP